MVISHHASVRMTPLPSCPRSLAHMGLVGNICVDKDGGQGWVSITQELGEGGAGREVLGRKV